MNISTVTFKKVANYSALKLLCYLTDSCLSDTFVFNKYSAYQIECAYLLTYEQVKTSLAYLVEVGILTKIKRGTYQLTNEETN